MFQRKSALFMLLESMGINIDPAEVMTKYEQAKDIMPKLADFVNTLDGRLERLEKRLDEIQEALNVPSNR
jgi:hypothetical protein